MARRTGKFLREFVVLVGFLNGVWIAVGVNPARTLLEVIEGLVENLLSGVPLEFLFAFLPLAILVATLWLIWRRGGWLGFVAVACAFLGGMLVIAAPYWSFGFLLAGLAVGWWATR